MLLFCKLLSATYCSWLSIVVFNHSYSFRLAVFIIVNVNVTCVVANVQPWTETCRVHYHEWKTSADGKERSFLLEGELYQQVEIDDAWGRYMKLNVPSIFNTMRSSTLHDIDLVCLLHLSIY